MHAFVCEGIWSQLRAFSLPCLLLCLQKVTAQRHRSTKAIQAFHCLSEQTLTTEWVVYCSKWGQDYIRRYYGCRISKHALIPNDPNQGCNINIHMLNIVTEKSVLFQIVLSGFVVFSKERMVPNQTATHTQSELKHADFPTRPSEMHWAVPGP